ncbi:MAG: hypothetical protein HY774_28625 [Acidobacteria bacterium]|nr:hypothetical protein [Acidobacteriota bacterium]
MGHCLQAFLGSEALLGEIVQTRLTAIFIPLSQGLAMIPVTEAVYDSLATIEERGSFDPRFLFLSPKLNHFGQTHSENGHLAYIETDYFGGAGSQGAIVWSKGKILFGPAVTGNRPDLQVDRLPADAINCALKILGVEKGHWVDEFEALGLGKYRSQDR